MAKKSRLSELGEFWKSRSSEDCSDETMSEIARNVAGFFSVLNDWDMKEVAKTGEPDGSPRDTETRR